MKKIVGVFLLLLIGPLVFATGTHKDDWRYQPLIDRLAPTFETVTRGLTLGDKEFQQLSVIARGKSTEQLCQQLFKNELSTTSNYCDAGQPGITKTQDLQAAGACLNRIHLQATGKEVTPTEKDCFDDLYNFGQAGR